MWQDFFNIGDRNQNKDESIILEKIKEISSEDVQEAFIECKARMLHTKKSLGAFVKEILNATLTHNSISECFK